jgi:hypothetical protein
LRRAALALAMALLAAGCGANDEPAAPTEETGSPNLGTGEARLPPQVADFPPLTSQDCAEVVQFYLEALGGREYAQAALVWDDPVIDAARLESLFGAYREPQVEWTEPFVEGAAGSLYCTVSGKLTDARDPAKPMREGTLLLRRANDVPGAAPDQLRWTLQSSTFVEKLERSGTGEP